MTTGRVLLTDDPESAEARLIGAVRAAGHAVKWCKFVDWVHDDESDEAFRFAMALIDELRKSAAPDQPGDTAERGAQ